MGNWVSVDADRLQDALSRLEHWLERNGWAGYDPYDIRGTPLFLRLQRLGPKASFPVRALRRTLFSLANRYPLAMRRLLGVRKRINPKSLGLLALGHLARFEATGKDNHRQRAVACLEWLEANAQPAYAGACWGYLFDWHTRVEIPAGTPSAVVSAVVGWAFLEAYQLLDDHHYLDVARSTANFFLHDLNIDRLDASRACFSYTPLDHFHVHNANLFVAAHLGRVGALTGETPYAEAAKLAVAYTLGEQNDDGSWYYWGPPDELNHVVDHYHTGFVLRCLDRLCDIGASDSSQWEGALERGLRFYLEHLFEDSGLPKLKPNTTYPVDIHSCAEAILCLTQLGRRYPAAKAQLSRVLNWTLGEMQAADGHFYYRKYAHRSDRMAYIRWGQAWMLWALAACAVEMGSRA